MPPSFDGFGLRKQPILDLVRRHDADTTWPAEKMFTSPEACIISGIARNSAARADFEKNIVVPALLGVSNGYINPPEIVIGAGLHAAVWCSMRPGKAFVIGPPYQATFSCRTTVPRFYLNHRNRPGESGLPRTEGSLARIPGARIQASDMNSLEYQTDADFGLAIRTNLMMSMVGNLSENARQITSDEIIYTEFGSRYPAKRIIIATGPKMRPTLENTISARAFLAMIAKLYGRKRVAVIGAGDTGRVVVEALLGQGPRSMLTPVEQIDWYGQVAPNGFAFEQCNRRRYKRIALDFPDDSGSYSRIRPFTGRAIEVQGDRLVYQRDGGLAISQPYDAIVDARGLEAPNPYALLWEDAQLEYVYGKDSKPIARKVVDKEVYLIGPCAGLPDDVNIQGIPENSIAAWRYTEKTAELARLVATREEG